MSIENRKPHLHELRSCQDVLAWYKEYLEKHEPSAVNTINVMEQASMGLLMEDELADLKD